MKHLKTYNESVESSEYYTIVTQANVDIDKMINMSYNDIYKLSDIFKYGQYISSTLTIGENGYIPINSKLIRAFDIKKATIFSMRDEYYIVCIPSNGEKFLCDQWEGLIKLLEDSNLLPAVF